MSWLIWLAIIVIGVLVALSLWAMCRIGGQADELTARIRQRQTDDRRGNK